VSQARKSVVLGVERYGPSSFAVGKLSSEGCADVICAASHIETLLFQVGGEDLVGMNLFISVLGVLPDL
jgi:hypothetical protein